MPALSIIVITRNRPRMLADCLARAADGAPPDTEFIVVDSSDDDATERIAAGFGRARLVRLRGERNNMPRARNLGVAAAAGEVVAFLDDDSMPEPGWAAAVLRGYADPTVAGVSGCIVDTGEEPVKEGDAAGPRIEKNGRLRGSHAIAVTAPQDADFFRGCNMTFRRRAVVQAGGFDENLTGNNFREDGDACLRVARAGGRLVVVPGAGVRHLNAPREDVSRDPFSFRTRYYNTRNNVYMVLKHLGPRPAVLARHFILDPVHLLGAAVKNFYRPQFWSAFIAALSGLAAGAWTAAVHDRKLGVFGGSAMTGDIDLSPLSAGSRPPAQSLVRWAWFAFLLATALRASNIDFPFINDGGAAYNIYAARPMLNPDGGHPPLGYLLYKVPVLLAPRNPWAVRLVPWAASILIAWLAFRAARRRFGDAVAALTLLGLAVSYPAFISSLYIHFDNTGAALFMLLAADAWLSDAPGWRRPVRAGLFWGLAGLFKLHVGAAAFGFAAAQMLRPGREPGTAPGPSSPSALRRMLELASLGLVALAVVAIGAPALWAIFQPDVPLREAVYVSFFGHRVHGQFSGGQFGIQGLLGRVQLIYVLGIVFLAGPWLLALSRGGRTFGGWLRAPAGRFCAFTGVSALAILGAFSATDRYILVLYPLLHVCGALLIIEGWGLSRRSTPWVLAGAAAIAAALFTMRAAGVQTPIFLSSLGPAGFLFGRWFAIPYIAVTVFLAALASLPAARRIRGLAGAAALTLMTGVMLWMSANTWVEKKYVKAAYDEFRREVSAEDLPPLIDANFNSEYVLGLYNTMGHACRIWDDRSSFERAMGIPVERVIPDGAAPEEEWRPLLDPRGRGVRSLVRLDWKGMDKPEDLKRNILEKYPLLTDIRFIEAGGRVIGFTATVPTHPEAPR
jgi:GT2 family glycosyltransferase